MNYNNEELNIICKIIEKNVEKHGTWEFEYLENNKHHGYNYRVYKFRNKYKLNQTIKNFLNNNFLGNGKVFNDILESPIVLLWLKEHMKEYIIEYKKEKLEQELTKKEVNNKRLIKV